MPAEINIYNPEALGPPMGQYTHVTRVRANEFVFVAGMLSGDAAGTLPKLLHRNIFRRIPKRVDGVHRRKLEHDHRSRIWLALQQLNFSGSNGKLPAEFHDERNDGVAILLVLLFVADGTLDHEIASHASPVAD